MKFNVIKGLLKNLQDCHDLEQESLKKFGIEVGTLPTSVLDPHSFNPDPDPGKKN